MARLSFIAVFAWIACLTVAPSASASRLPTEQELTELTAAAQSTLNASSYYNPSLSKVRISTVNETWAAGWLEPQRPGRGDPQTGIFKRDSNMRWGLVAYGDDCGVAHGIGMPLPVQRDLGVEDCTHQNREAVTVQVICATTYGSVGRGAYFTRPRSCMFHERGRPVAYAWLVIVKHLHWLHWGRKVAVGVGKEAVNMTGLVPVKVRLSAPVTICGHTVFTKAHFNGRGRGLTLDNRLTSPTCA